MFGVAARIRNHGIANPLAWLAREQLFDEPAMEARIGAAEGDVERRLASVIGQSPDRPVDYRMSPVARDFRGRLERESSKRKTGMRNDELWEIDDLIVVQQQVDVERARRPMFESLATAELFDGPCVLEQFRGVELSFEDGRRIQELALADRSARGRGRPPRTNGLNATRRDSVQPVKSRAESVLAIAEI